MPEKPAESTAPRNERELQKVMDEAEKKGYLGVVPDPTPNENYSLETPPDAPTPETDPKLAAKVGSTKFANAEEN